MRLLDELRAAAGRPAVRPAHVPDGIEQEHCCRPCCTWELTNDELKARQEANRLRWQLRR